MPIPLESLLFLLRKRCHSAWGSRLALLGEPSRKLRVRTTPVPTNFGFGRLIYSNKIQTGAGIVVFLEG